MSNLVTNLCRPLQTTPAQKAVLMALADRADDDGAAWPSLAWLSEWSCLGRSTVIRALVALEDLQLIVMARADGRASRCTIVLGNVVVMVSNPSRSGTPTRPAAAPVDSLDPSQIGTGDDAAEASDPSQIGTRPAAGPVPDRDPHPSRSGTPTRPAAGPTRPAAGPDTSISINKTSDKTKRERARAPDPEPVTDLPGVSPELLGDYMAVRKARKAGPLTETAVKGLEREAQKAGISLAQAVTYSCEQGWQGFKAEWYFRREGGDARSPSGGRGQVVL